jgi:hypothetical protein
MKRNIWLDILFTILTVGLYNLYFQLRKVLDINEREGKEVFTFWKVALFSVLTFGFYFIYHQFKVTLYLHEKTFGDKKIVSSIWTIPITFIGLWILVDVYHQLLLNSAHEDNAFIKKEKNMHFFQLGSVLLTVACVFSFVNNVNFVGESIFSAKYFEFKGLDWSCNSGDMDDCYELGIVYLKNGYEYEALGLLQKSCDAGLEGACLNYYELRFETGRMEGIELKNRELCNVEKINYACYILGRFYEENKKDRLTEEYYDKACYLRSTVGCVAQMKNYCKKGEVEKGLKLLTWSLKNNLADFNYFMNIPELACIFKSPTVEDIFRKWGRERK